MTPTTPALRSEVGAALRDAAPVALAMVPIGLGFGLFLTHAGLAWWCAPLFASVIFAGSFEFVLVGLVAAAAPLAAIALTAVLVNGRHVFYTLSFPLDRVQGRWAKAYSSFALTDEAYVLATAPRARTWTGPRLVALQAFMHLSWISGATAGALLGAVIPASVTGLEFTMTALFVVLALDGLRAKRDLSTPALAGVCAGAALLLLPGEMLLGSIALFALALLLSRFVPGRSSARLEGQHA